MPPCQLNPCHVGSFWGRIRAPPTTTVSVPPRVFRSESGRADNAKSNNLKSHLFHPNFAGPSLYNSGSVPTSHRPPHILFESPSRDEQFPQINLSRQQLHGVGFPVDRTRVRRQFTVTGANHDRGPPLLEPSQPRELNEPLPINFHQVFVEISPFWNPPFANSPRNFAQPFLSHPLAVSWRRSTNLLALPWPTQLSVLIQATGSGVLQFSPAKRSNVAGVELARLTCFNFNTSALPGRPNCNFLLHVNNFGRNPQFWGVT
ncbi:UNVERIFIED_CONTAM: hypothetical protein Slati_3951700 [Sesamum latifolium]|uniref:Uncharacterized protein n=1 Tax=Sesamum latifolium TaxID=2727402 RepID=A0AAW2TN56_9LAMI